MEEMARNRCVLKEEPIGLADGFKDVSEGKQLRIIILDL